MLNNWVNFWFSIIKKLLDLAQENWVIYKVAMAFWINIYGCQPYPRHGHLSVNQLKNQSYCSWLYEKKLQITIDFVNKHNMYICAFYLNVKIWLSKPIFNVKNLLDCSKMSKSVCPGASKIAKVSKSFPEIPTWLEVGLFLAAHLVDGGQRE